MSLIPEEHLPVLLDALKKELKQQKLWSVKPPSAQALLSQQPFCCDTLALEQWLQYVFIPRLTAMLTAGKSLPSRIAVSPMAEEAFASLAGDEAKLIAIISEIDQLLSGCLHQSNFAGGSLG
jgi:uncharacterized protein YqcC (DUF446 family)